jgi:hypothetical protein
MIWLFLQAVADIATGINHATTEIRRRLAGNLVHV